MTAFASTYQDRPRPESGLARQLQAAETRAADFVVIESIEIGTPGAPPPLDPERVTGPVRKIIDRFRDADEHGRMTWCRHLKPDSPRPATWLAWRPSRLYCPPCMTRLPPLTGKEDRRCDACRWVGTRIWPHRVIIPGRMLAPREGKPQEVRPPAILMFGLCGRCQAKATAAAADAAEAMPCRFRLPDAGRPVSAREAAHFRKAAELAKAIGEGDQRKAADLLPGPGTSLPELLWAAAVLVISITQALISQATWRDDIAPPEPPDLWDQIPATMTRLVSYAPESGLVSPALGDFTAGAVDLIKQVHRGDCEALIQLDAHEAATLLGGTTWVLGAIVQWPVQAGLAATADQVWTELSGSIGRWETPH